MHIVVCVLYIGSVYTESRQMDYRKDTQKGLEDLNPGI